DALCSPRADLSRHRWLSLHEQLGVGLLDALHPCTHPDSAWPQPRILVDGLWRIRWTWAVEQAVDDLLSHRPCACLAAHAATQSSLHAIRRMGSRSADTYRAA